jgi:hypothetical protein
LKNKENLREAIYEIRIRHKHANAIELI